jgi:hypothetical protein
MFEAFERTPWDKGIVPFVWYRECRRCHRAVYGVGGEEVVSPAYTLHIVDRQPYTRCGLDAAQEAWVWRV